MPFSQTQIQQSAWNTIFSQQAIRSYVAGAIKLYDALVRLEQAGSQAVVFPSRGTTPFGDLVQIIHSSNVVESRGAHPLWHRVQRPFAYSTLELPFTADPPETHPGGHAAVRDFWVRVLKAYLTSDVTSPELRYYQYALAHLFGFEPSHGAPIRSAGTRFVFVDTVVSGQAICEIAQSFKSHGLTDFHLLLLVDQNGTKLKPQYRMQLAALQAQGNAELIYVDSLFTEDKGPVMTGTWCLSVPQLVEAAGEVLPGHAGIALAGTAVSFVRVRYDQQLDNHASTVMAGTLFALLHTAVSQALEVGIALQEMYERMVERTRIKLVSLAMTKENAGYNPLDPRETERVARISLKSGISVAVDRKPIGLPVSAIHASSSHVVRLSFGERDVMRFLRAFSADQATAITSKQQI